MWGDGANLNETENPADVGDGRMPGGPQSENGVRTGQVVDRYRIVRAIASGGMSRVYEAVHMFTHKTIALKVMRARFSERQDVISRFRHEAMALSSIQHPNVVRVENAGLTDDGHVFIAMELLKGQNLREVLQVRKALGVRESLELVAGVAHGVAAAHAANVIHRDLKPENIFCVAGGSPKVLDLGTAKFAGDNVPTTQTAHGKIVGTAAYVAPERLQGDPGDERCDIYSLGLILYECLAGFHPLAPERVWPEAVEIASRQISFRPSPIRGLSQAVNDVVATAIHKEPKKRYRSMFAFSESIRGLLRSVEGEHSVGHQPRRFPRTHLLNRPIAMGLVVGAVVGGAAFRYSSARTVVREPEHEITASANDGSEVATSIPVPPVGRVHPLLNPSTAEMALEPSEIVVVNAPNEPLLDGAGGRESAAKSAKSDSRGPASSPSGLPDQGVRSSKSPGGVKTDTGSPGRSLGTKTGAREDLPASGL